MDVRSVPIKGFEHYTVNENGDIFNTLTGKKRKPSVSRNGYCSVDLYNKTKMKRFFIHRLVATAFLPNPNNYPQVNHKDENPRNNNVQNLEWCTAKYNMSYGIGGKTRHLKIDYTKPCYRENAIKNGKKCSKPVAQYDKEGNFIRAYESAKEASRITKADHSHILDCCNYKPGRYSAGGYIWKFERSDDLSQSPF